MNRKKSFIVLAFIVIILGAFGIAKIYRHYQIEECIKKGGYWNKELNKCQTIDSTSNNKDYYWHTAYDSTLQREYLEKGKLMDSISHSASTLIDALNKRAANCKIKYLDMTGDTLHISILQDEVLTEQLGSTGAHCYLGETVYTLTENDSIKQVDIAFNEGSHAAPGVYNRKNFTDLVKE